MNLIDHDSAPDLWHRQLGPIS